MDTVSDAGTKKRTPSIIYLLESTSLEHDLSRNYLPLNHNNTISSRISESQAVAVAKGPPVMSANFVPGNANDAGRYAGSKLLGPTATVTRGIFPSNRSYDQSYTSLPWKATGIAAAVESFYRSALNSKINQALTGVRGQLFPNMHVQLPTRVVYITGFKSIRTLVDHYLTRDVATQNIHYNSLRVIGAILPGIVMTPISSVLEACNATLNPEPLYKRWLNGISARCTREVVFGIGLNQLSDHFEAQMPSSMSPILRNAGGCLTAGVIAGYLSHVPHNLSTMKLMNPKQSYRALLQQFSRQWYGRLGIFPHESLRSTTAMILSIIAPQGLGVRTVQVVGSFIVLNGIIASLRGHLGEA